MSNEFGMFARRLVAGEPMNLAMSEHLHRKWLRAKPQTRKQMRFEWCVEYVMGRMQKPSETAARKILEKSRTSRTRAEQLVVDAASHKFLYHVARNGIKTVGVLRENQIPRPRI
jgi:hypothetical protein